MSKEEKKSGLATAGMVLGIIAIVGSWIPFLNIGSIIMGVLALIFGGVALAQKRSKGKAIAAVVLGALSVIIGIYMTVGASKAIDDATTKSTTQKTSSEKESTKKPSVPAEYTSALNKATTYANTMDMSKAAVYDQLVSPAGEKFSKKAAQYAIDHVKANWNKNALAKAKTYQETMSMSPAAIHDQLTSNSGEKFTAAQADYAIKHLND